VVFKMCCQVLGVSGGDGTPFVPHSLRHGGATRLYVVHRWPIQDILYRGRWQQSKAATIYIQSSRAAMLTNTIPHHLQQPAAYLRDNLINAILPAIQHYWA
jgi:hypothetical protein